MIWVIYHAQSVVELVENVKDNAVKSVYMFFLFFFFQGVLGCKTLINLFANRLLIKELPSNFGDLEQLQILSMTESLLTSLPDSFSQLINLKTLEMGGVSWVEKDDTSNAILSHDAFEEHLKKSLPADTMSKEVRKNFVAV